jgi:cystathionine beta-synthase
MTAAHNVIELIGNTPIIELPQIDTGPCRLFVKLENQNPGGSIKDRIGLSMIEAAERDGRLKPGGTIVEATAGNTGLGLALVASQKGYRLIIVIPDKMSQEKIFNLKAMGAEILLTRSDVGKGHPDYYQDKAAAIVKDTPGAIYINQFENPANPLAHETGTGPEIWAQMGHDVDAVVCGVGSGGTITGLSRFFEKVNPDTEMILADPKGSILADYVDTGELKTEVGSWLVEGIGEDFIPPVCDLSRVKQAITVDDAESFQTAREVLEKTGILAGTSSGTLIAAAIRYCREQTEPKRVVTFVCDSGNKYLSKAFNDYWMFDQGLLKRKTYGDLRDLISRPFEEGGTVTARSSDTLMTVYSRMKLNDVSQLPVMEDDLLVGIIHESDILLSVYEDQEKFGEPASIAMTKGLETVDASANIQDLMPIFDHGHVAIVKNGDSFSGLITRIDLLNYLRRSAA